MKNDSVNYFCSQKLRQQGHRLVDMLADYLAESTGDHSTTVAEKVLDYRHHDELYRKWKSITPGQQNFDQLIEEVIRQSIRLHHPRYLGHQISPPATSAALSGLVSDLLNNGMGVYEMGMAGTVLERIVTELVADQFGFTENPAGFLTSGGSLGNLTALLAARNFCFPDTNELGQTARPAIMVSEQAHYCMQRAASIMGWGTGGVISVPANGRFQMDTTQLPERLKQARQAGQSVVAVVGSACSTATGAYDDLRAIGEFCRDNQLWFHVDGADGAAVAFSGKYRYLIEGIELADSVVMDFHKLLLTPALATAVVFRERRNARNSFAQKADYLFSADDQDMQWENLALRTFECTKFMMSLKVYSIFAEYGLNAWNDNVTRLYDLARIFAGLVEENERVQLLARPESNIVCYRFVASDESRCNQINQKIRETILREGKFYIVQTRIDGTKWLRSTIGSATTTELEIRELLEEVVHIGTSLEASLSAN